MLVPDIAGWRRERLPAVPDEPYLTLAPDWVCEVLSASTERIDRGPKLRIYAREGVAHAWLVNPTNRTLEILCDYLGDMDKPKVSFDDQLQACQRVVNTLAYTP